MEAPSEVSEPGADADLEIGPQPDLDNVPGRGDNSSDFVFTSQDIYVSLTNALSVYYVWPC